MPAADQPVANFTNDSPLWYNNGVFGALGYAVANLGEDPRTLNQGIWALVNVIGRNLSAIMQSPDVDLRTPPKINTLIKVHKLILRARTIITSRAVLPGTPMLEGPRDVPAPIDFLIYPIPFFRVRNTWMREWSSLILSAMTNAIQHTENREPMDFSTTFGGLIGQYLSRVYTRMAIELLGIDQGAASAPGFTLTDAQLAAYDPTKWFTATELIDTTPPTYNVPSAKDLRVLTDGIPATRLVNLQQYPGGALPLQTVLDDSAANIGEAGPTMSGGAGAATSAGTSSTGASGTAPFPPPPGP